MKNLLIIIIGLIILAFLAFGFYHLMVFIFKVIREQKR